MNPVTSLSSNEVITFESITEVTSDLPEAAKVCVSRSASWPVPPWYPTSRIGTATSVQTRATWTLSVKNEAELNDASLLRAPYPHASAPATLTSVKGSAIVPWINVPVAVPRTATATPYHGPSTIADTAVPIMSRYSARWSVPTTA